VYTPEEIGRVVGLVRKHDLFLIGDEVYKEFIYDGLKHKSILEYPDIKDGSSSSTASPSATAAAAPGSA